MTLCGPNGSHTIELATSQARRSRRRNPLLLSPFSLPPLDAPCDAHATVYAHRPYQSLREPPPAPRARADERPPSR